jgi:tetratricopeptide (TPR) repeat protein
MSDKIDQLLTQAYQARRDNRPADAKQMFGEAVDLCRADGGAALARALTGLGQIERDMGRLDVARRQYEAALAIYRVAGDSLKVAHTVRHLGDIHHDNGRPELAEPCYIEALALYRRDPRTPPIDLANAIRGFAILKEDAGQTEEATALWEEARDLYASVSIQAGVTESARRIARLSTS